MGKGGLCFLVCICKFVFSLHTVESLNSIYRWGKGQGQGNQPWWNGQHSRTDQADLFHIPTHTSGRVEDRLLSFLHAVTHFFFLQLEFCVAKKSPKTNRICIKVDISKHCFGNWHLVENETQMHYETNYTIKVKKEQLSIARILHENHCKHCLTLWNQISSGFVIYCGRFMEATQLLLLNELVFLQNFSLLLSSIK